MWYIEKVEYYDEFEDKFMTETSLTFADDFKGAMEKCESYYGKNMRTCTIEVLWDDDYDANVFLVDEDFYDKLHERNGSR